jgi:hypothetical protein
MVLDEKMRGEKAEVEGKSNKCEVALRWQRVEEKIGLLSKHQKAGINREGHQLQEEIESNGLKKF